LSPSAAESILLVEDNEDVREGLSLLLESEGFELVAASSAEEGLAHLQARTFELIITDYMLPAQSGGWMVEQAKKAGRLNMTRVLMITAHPRVLPPPGVRILHKPLDIDELLRVVREELAKLGLRSMKAS
jgi:DNA-binding response OmpR family regulator